MNYASILKRNKMLTKLGKINEADAYPNGGMLPVEAVSQRAKRRIAALKKIKESK